jgi:predicted nucleic acid-binding protein
MKDADHLVDSSAYIDLMRAGQDPRQVLAPLLRAGRLYNCGVVRAEVLRGIKVEKRYAQMEQFFDLIPEIPTDARLWRDVSQLGWELGRAGKWPPLADLAIAVAALRVRAVVISSDAHFRDVPGLEVCGTLDEVM